MKNLGKSVTMSVNYTQVVHQDENIDDRLSDLIKII